MMIRKILNNKKGAEFTIGTLVVIILAVIVLVVLIMGFVGGWGNLWANISNFFSAGVSVEAAQSACKMACDLKNEQDFCCAKRSVKFGSEVEKGVTCQDNKLGVSCPSISCSITCYLSEDEYAKFCKDNCGGTAENNNSFCKEKQIVFIKSSGKYEDWHICQNDGWMPNIKSACKTAFNSTGGIKSDWCK